MSSRKVYPDGRIVGTVDFPFDALRDPTVAFPILTEEWRSALDLYVISADASIPLTSMGLTTKVYVMNAGATALAQQSLFGFPGAGWGSGPGGVPPSADLFNWPIMRFRSFGGEQLKVTMQSLGDSGPRTNRRMRIAYVAYGFEPCADVDPISFWHGPSGYADAFPVLPAAGRLLDMSVMNAGPTDQWLVLFDEGVQRPGSPPSILPMAAGPFYLPANGKGQAFLDFRAQRGLAPRWGLFGKTSASPAFPFVPDPTAQWNATINFA